MSASASPLGYGLYFLDVLACTLFCLAFALVGARFSREVAIPVDLPRAQAAAAPGSGLATASLVVRGDPGAPEFFLDGEPVDLVRLEARLRSAPPAALVVRSEDSPVARVIAMAHAAGVREIGLAYRAAPRAEER
jgi:biopolymer transport protein ExbD